MDRSGTDAPRLFAVDGATGRTLDREPLGALLHRFRGSSPPMRSTEGPGRAVS